MSPSYKGIFGSVLVAAAVLALASSAPHSASAQVVTPVYTTTSTTLSSSDIASLENEVQLLTTEIQSLTAQISARMAANTSASITTSTTMPTTGMCYAFSGNNISMGANGVDVNLLQTFLMKQGYLNIAAPTGYFGNLTQAALQQYQNANSLSGSSYGMVDSSTISKINASCTLTNGNTNTTTTTNTGTMMPTNSVPMISSFGSNTVTAGSPVTINGSNFGSNPLMVTLTGPNGNTMISNLLPSNNGTMLSFTLPMTNASSSECSGTLYSSACNEYMIPGSYTVSVQGQNGTSNYSTLTVNSYNPSMAPMMPANNASSTPTILSFNNASGSIGNIVTINGSGFAPTGNTVMFGTTMIPNLSSTNNGTTIQFTVPSLTGTNTLLTPGNYNISVKNAYATSSAMTYNVH